MASIADFSITDGILPVNLTHRSHTANELVMADAAATAADTATTLLLADITTKRGSTVRRPRLKLTMYYMETVSGSVDGYVAPPKVAYINTVQTDFVVNKRTAVSQISYMRKLMSYALGDTVSAIIRDAVDSNKKPY